MAKITLQGNPIHTFGDLPEINKQVPDFKLVDNTLKDVTLDNFKGKNIIFNIFPSLDTSVCSQSVRKFNELATKIKDSVVLCISRDLPFAQARFCGAEGLDNVITLSEFRDQNFSKKFGVLITDSSMQGLMARAVFVCDKEGKVIYKELVPEIAQEPNYEKALQALTQ